ncbi:YLMG-like protein 1-2 CHLOROPLASTIC [Salix viminalis]|uniref:YLMG-like protein 1-2 CHLOROPLASTIC n=1 Tax=Salix viminalis TaxID=40686 RepID=A0A6N2KF64_SALVM|nr:YLMG-like protein 1-2 CHLOROPLASTIC [Salix viminalis]
MATMLSSQTGAVLRAPFLTSHSKLSRRPPLTTTTLCLPSQNPPSLALKFPKSPLSPTLTAKQRILRVHLSPQSTQIPAESQPLLTGSTRTVATILTLALSLSRILVASIQKSVLSLNVLPTPDQLMAIRALQSNLGHSLGPLFFAALRDRPTGYLNTPLTVVAAGLAKWLDIYSGVLMVRVLLSWFPNIPWDRQPLSAIRDLCDPYLNLFRNIIPPIFDTLDVSPLLAFAVLGTLGSILNSSRGMY